jgi:uncharacterized repeat protein (TIGR01451 family)
VSNKADGAGQIISLPNGGGVLRGIGEKFAADLSHRNWRYVGARREMDMKPNVVRWNLVTPAVAVALACGVVMVVVLFLISPAAAFPPPTVVAGTTFTDIGPDESGEIILQPGSGNEACPAPCPGGGSGGRVNGLAAVPGNASTYFAASEVGGLFKTIDGGNTWFHLDGHLPTRTWDVAAAPGGLTVYATSFYDGRVNSLAGIQVSYDGGINWTRPELPAPDTCPEERRTQPSGYGVAVRPGAPTEVLAGTNCGIVRSEDAGLHWTSATGTSRVVWDVVALPGGRAYACGEDGVLSSGDGQAWTRVSQPAPNRIYCSIAVSPDEPDVVFVAFARPTFDPYLTARDPVFFQSHDGGASWSALPHPDVAVGVNPKSRAAFVVTNKRSIGFDLWLADGNLMRVPCTTGTTGPRCTTDTTQWSGTFTDAGNPPDNQKAHGDSGDLEFDPMASVDACPTMYSSDGGIYRNSQTMSPTCHTNALFLPVNVGVHAIFVLGMAGVNRPDVGDAEIYIATQDVGIFSTANAGSTAPTWTHFIGGDGNDVVADTSRVVTQDFVLRTGLPGLTNMKIVVGDDPKIPWAPCVAHGVMEVIDQDALGRYVIAVGAYGTDCPVGRSVRLTSDIAGNPFGAALGTWPDAEAPCHVRASVGATGPEYYVQAGACNGRSPDRLYRFAATDALNPFAGTWTQITDTTLPTGAGFALFGADPVNRNRLYVAVVGDGDPRMLRSTDGGAGWQVDQRLTDLLHGVANGSPRFVAQASEAHDGVTHPEIQATLVAFDPENPNILVAGGRESGVFVSSDGGLCWALLTDPFSSGKTGIPHLPRPVFAHFDHEPPGATSIYLGMLGRGAWRLDLANADLLVTKSADFDQVRADTDLTYTIQVINAGPDPAMNVTMEDTLPAATSFQSVTAPLGWSCEAPPVGSTGRVTCTVASMAPGSATFVVVVRVSAATPGGTLLANRVRVFSAAVDGDPTNNAAEKTTTVVTKEECKSGGWRNFTNPTFRNQGQCIRWINTGQL